MKSFGLVIIFSFLIAIDIPAQSSFQLELTQIKTDSSSNFVIALPDGGFATKEVYRNNFAGTYNIVISKFNPCLQIVWSKSLIAHIYQNQYPWFPNNYYTTDASTFTQTSDGGFLIVYSDYSSNTQCGIIVKLDSSGNLVWSRKIIEPNINWCIESLACSERKVGSGGYLIVMQSDSISYDVSASRRDIRQCSVLALKNNGDVNWNKVIRSSYFSNQPTGWEKVRNVLATSDGGDYIFFSQMSAIIKIDSLGSIKWFKYSRGSALYGFHLLSSVAIDNNDNIYATGEYYPASYQYIAPFVTVIGSNGLTKWNAVYSPKGTSGTSITCKNENIYVSCSFLSDSIIRFLKLDTAGRIKWYSSLHQIFSAGGDILGRNTYHYTQSSISTAPDSGLIYMVVSNGHNSVIRTDQFGETECSVRDTFSSRRKIGDYGLADVPHQEYMGNLLVKSSIIIGDAYTKKIVRCYDKFYPQADLGNDTILCTAKSYTLASANDNHGCHFLWSTGDTTQTVIVNKSGKYWLSISHAYCTSTDTINVVFYQGLKKFKDHNPHICRYDSLLLAAPDSAVSFAWRTPRGKTINANKIWAKDTGYYYLSLIGQSNCTSVDSLHLGYYPMPKASAGPDTVLCYNQSYTMQGKGGITYKWIPAKYLSNDTLPDAVATLPDSQLYTLVVHNAEGCSDTSQVRLRVRPRLQAHVNSSSPKVSCDGGNILFTATGTGGYQPNYTWYWLYDHAKGDSVNIQVNSSGWHKVILQDYCSPPAADSIYITVPSKPVADFSMRPDSQVSAGTDISFYNLSRNSSHYYWNFGDRQKSSAATESPVFTYKDTGLYKISLIAWNSEGCSDTAVKYIHVLDNFLLYIPNAFSPNDDGLNDEFRIEGSAIKSISYSIYNRWGERIFQSTPEEPSWNGRFNNQGDKSPTGIYLYILKATDNLNEPYYYKGTVEVVR